MAGAMMDMSNLIPGTARDTTRNIGRAKPKSGTVAATASITTLNPAAQASRRTSPRTLLRCMASKRPRPITPRFSCLITRAARVLLDADKLLWHFRIDQLFRL